MTNTLRSGPVAGRNATFQLDHQAQREKQLKDWEARLIAKDMELNGKQISNKDSNGVQDVVRNVKEVCSDS